MRLRNHVVLGSTVLTAIAGAGMAQKAIALPLVEQPNEQPDAAVQVSQESLPIPIPIPVIEPDVQRISQTTSVDQVPESTDTAVPESQTEETTSPQASSSTPQRLDQVRAKVVDVSNEGDVLVRLPNGNYKRLSRVNPSVLTSLDPGDEVILTTLGDNVLNVALASDDIQQAEVEDDVEVEVVDSQNEVEEEQTVERTVERTTTQTETTVQRETQPQYTPPRSQPLPTTPVPYVPPAPAALW